MRVDIRQPLVDLGDPERLAADLVVALGVHQVGGAEEDPELPEVELGDEDLAEAREDLAGVLREGVEVAQVRVPGDGSMDKRRRALAAGAIELDDRVHAQILELCA